MSEAWYPISAMRRANVVVMIRWSWWQGEASLVYRNKKHGYQWATLRDGKAVFLPERGVGRDWPSEPHSWRPIGVWADPLPEPLKNGPFEDQKPAKSNVQVNLQASEAEYSRGREWWRDDIPKLRMEEPPSRDAVEYRVMRALAQVNVGIGNVGIVQSAVFRSIEEANADMENGPQSDWRPRFKPNPADESDFDVAMGWFTALNPPEFWHSARRPWSISSQQKVLIWRALPVPWSFQEIAERCRLTGEAGERRARYLFDDGLKKCWLVANGRKPFHGRSIMDQIELLKERNRAWKRL